MDLYRVTMTILCSKVVEANNEQGAIDQVMPKDLVNTEVVDRYIADEIKVEKIPNTFRK